MLFFLFICVAFAQKSFYGPHPLKEHTYHYEPQFENESISKLFTGIVFILPLIVLTLCVCFFSSFQIVVIIM